MAYKIKKLNNEKKFKVNVGYTNLKNKTLIIKARNKNQAFLKLNERYDIDEIENIGDFKEIK